METNAFAESPIRFKIGYLMLISSGLMPVSYLILMFSENEGRTLFMSYVAFSLYAFLVLLFPFQERKKWAWAATWILPVVMALTAFFAPEFGFYYFGAAAVFAVGLLLTMKDFFSTSR